MAEGVGVGRAIVALFCAAEGDDPEPAAAFVVATPVDCRDRLEEYVYAYASAATRGKDVNLSAPPCPHDDAIDPLTPQELDSACRSLASAGPAHSPRMARWITYTLCCNALRAREWSEIEAPPRIAERARLIRLVTTAAKSCTFAAFGDRYVELMIRLQVLPAWSSVTTPMGVAPHAVVAELMPGREANDAVRSIIDTPIRSAFSRDAWSSRHKLCHCLAAATAVLQELTGGLPRVLVNEAINRHATDGTPDVALVRGMAVGGGTFVGVVIGDYSETSDAWTMPVADCLVQWLHRAREHGVGAVSDVVAAVIDDDPNSAVHQAYLQFH